MKHVSSLFLALALTAVFFSTGVLAAPAGDKLIPFKTKTMDGKTIDLEKISAKKPVMLFFWASW
jgi:hypothetical protein